MTALESAQRAAEDLAAHGAMRREFEAWINDKREDLFDLAHRLNAAAARAVTAIRDARRD
jgi:hypothetical protein